MRWCYIRWSTYFARSTRKITKIEEEMQLRFEEPVNMMVGLHALNAFFGQGIR